MTGTPRRRRTDGPPMYRAIFELMPWRKEVIALHGGTPDRLADYVRDGIHVEYKAAVDHRGHAFMYEGKPYVLWVASLADVRSVVHECQHITFAVLRSRGIRPGAATEEAYAYTLEHMVGLMLDHADWTLLA